MLRERSLIQKSTYYRILFVSNSRAGKTNQWWEDISLGAFLEGKDSSSPSSGLPSPSDPGQVMVSLWASVSPPGNFSRGWGRCLLLPPMLTFRDSGIPLQARPPQESPGPGCRWLRPSGQGKECPWGSGAPASGRPGWSWMPGTHHKRGWGPLRSRRAQGLEGKRSGRAPSAFVPVSRALQANDNVALRIKAPCPEF